MSHSESHRVTARLNMFQPIFFSGKCHSFSLTCHLRLPCRPVIGDFINIFLNLPSDHEVYRGSVEILFDDPVVARVDRISVNARVTKDKDALGNHSINIESDLAIAPVCADIKYAQQALEALLQGLGAEWKYKKSTDLQCDIDAKNLMLRGMWKEFTHWNFESEFEDDKNDRNTESKMACKMPKLTEKGRENLLTAQSIYRDHRSKNPKMPSPPTS